MTGAFRPSGNHRKPPEVNQKPPETCELRVAAGVTQLNGSREVGVVCVWGGGGTVT